MRKTGGRPKDSVPPSPEPSSTEEAQIELPMIGPATSQYAEVGRGAPMEEPTVAPTRVARGVVVFDLDGTILDNIGLISHVAADVMAKAFGTPEDEARIHYLATTGMPFEAQLAQLYPTSPAALRATTARTFHERKINEAYRHAAPFPEVPRLLRRLSEDRWTLVVSTGAEREMAELVLEREGLRYWFEGVLGSGQGTKKEHLLEYQRRYPGAAMFLVGDSRFDMEVGSQVTGVTAVGRASAMHGWTLTPDDLRRWGAGWADYSLAELPAALDRLERPAKSPRRKVRHGTRSRKGG